MTESAAASRARSDPASSVPTVWVFGDQLNRRIGSLADRSPGDCRVLIVESRSKLQSKRWHVQRAHLVVSAMAHFAGELEAEGFAVDHRRAPSLRVGLQEHRAEFGSERVIAMEPMSWDGREMLADLGVETVQNDQFVCHYQDFAEWAAPRKSLKMEDFYRWQRTRTGVLIDDGEPVGGRWNFDHDNREPPPRDGRAWPKIRRFELDDIDHDVLSRLPEGWGASPTGIWPVTRAQALERLNWFITTGLAPFGAHEDAMLAAEWKLAHSTLSSSLNLGLLHPAEVIEAAEQAHRRGDAPLNSAEGFIRQVLGWREYVWGLYWLWMPDYRLANVLEATRPVPPAFTGESSTEMACVASVMSNVHDHAYAHHIERLMVLGNLALTAGVDPQAMTQWMWASFVDGAEWVMLPNVIGMALYADGGMMSTKPYASGGAYINRMSDHCRGCRYDPKQRTGPDACPFTTLYWDFLARNESALGGNHRLARQLAGMRRLSDLGAVRQRARDVLVALDAGELGSPRIRIGRRFRTRGDGRHPMSPSSKPIPDLIGPGQESVWDYPRPPRLEASSRRVRVELAGTVIADSARALRVLETSHPPTYYVHPDDVTWDLVEPAAARGSWCEWKGQATYWTVLAGDVRVEAGAWSYRQPTPSFAAIAGHVAFYPALFTCSLDGELVTPQPGGFYGGWVTSELAGPFKGASGTRGW